MSRIVSMHHYYTVNATAQAAIDKYQKDKLSTGEIIHSLFSNEISNCGKASFCFIAEDMAEMCTNQICHAGMAYHRTRVNYSDFYTTCHPPEAINKKEIEIANAFVSWACDPDKSPWRNVLQGEVERTIIYKKDRPLSLHLHGNVHNLEKLTLHSLCVILRQVREKWDFITYWYDLVKNHGLSEADALIFVAGFSKVNGGSHVNLRPGTGHWPFDSVLYKSIDRDKFIHGNPDRRESKVNNCQGYTGTNSIWHHKNADRADIHFSEILKNANHKKSKSKVGLFYSRLDNYESPGAVPFEAAVKSYKEHFKIGVNA